MANGFVLLEIAVAVISPEMTRFPGRLLGGLPKT
jgi:hypothetical protein